MRQDCFLAQRSSQLESRTGEPLVRETGCLEKDFKIDEERRLEEITWSLDVEKRK